MNKTTTQALCDEVRDELARLVDGTAARELYDHVADCDDCRDLRHEATSLLGWVQSAGADHRSPVDLESSLLAALDARPVRSIDEGAISSVATPITRTSSSAEGVLPPQGTSEPSRALAQGDSPALGAQRSSGASPAQSGVTEVATLVSNVETASVATVVGVVDGPAPRIAEMPGASFAEVQVPSATEVPTSGVAVVRSSDVDMVRASDIAMMPVNVPVVSAAVMAPIAPIATELAPVSSSLREPVTHVSTATTEIVSTHTEVGRMDAEVLSSRPDSRSLVSSVGHVGRVANVPGATGSSDGGSSTAVTSSGSSGAPSELSGASSSSTYAYTPDPRGYDGSSPASRSPSSTSGSAPGTALVAPSTLVGTGASAGGDRKESTIDPVHPMWPAAKVIDLVKRRPRTVGFAGVAICAVAAAAAAMVVMGGGGSLGLRVAGDPWSGQVAAIGRAVSGAKDGLTLCNASGSSCVPVESGGAIAAGSLVRTDARTRAEIRLADGTTVVLDRASELVLDASESRTARLSKGAIVADVAHLENGPNARIVIPGGKIEVLGTKFAVFSDTDRSRVEVTRGVVQLTDDNGRSERVFAGEEGRMGGGRAVSVSPTTALGEVVELAEIKPRANTEGTEVKEEPVRGLGELRAKKPGQNDERDQVVRLAKHDVKVRIVDNVARTEIDETFQNDSGDELEGIYRFPLPPDAQIEKLSLEVNGKLEEGAFVEKDKAAAIWRGVIQHATPTAPKPVEEIVWVPGPWRDPALLEWKRGGRFELRIFPIPRNGSRRIVIAYTQTVAPVGGVRRYTYPLPFDTRGTAIDSAHFDVQVLGHDKSAGVRPSGYTLASAPSEAGERFEMSANRFIPSGDLSLEYSLPDRDRELTAWAYQPNGAASPVNAGGALTPGGMAVPGANGAPVIVPPGSRPYVNDPARTAILGAPLDSNLPYVVLALQPKLPRVSDDQARDHVLLVDTSRSMIGERFTKARSVAEAIIREMSSKDRVLVLACDTSCQGAGAGFASPGATTAETAGRFLKAITPEGASDLSAMVRAARLAADSGQGADSKRPLHVVYIGDGGASAGPTRPDHLTAEIQRILPGERGSVTAAAIGADADTVLLAAMARGGGGVVIPFVPGQRAVVAAMGVLGASYGTSLRTPELVLPAGFTQVSPATLDTIRPGTETLVVARMTDPSIEGEVTLKGKIGKDSFEQHYPLKVVATSDAGNAFVPRQFAATRIADLERTGGDASKVSIIDMSRRFAVASRYTSLLVLESEAMFTAFGLDRRRSSPQWTGEVAAANTSADGTTPVNDAPDDEMARGTGAGAGYGRMGGSHASRGAADFEMPFGGGPGDKAEAAPASKPKTANPPSPTATSAPVMPAKPAEMADPFSNEEKQDRKKSPASQAMPSRRPPRGGMIAMKKVYDRRGQVLPDVATWHTTDTGKMIAAENASLSRPDARATTRDLFGQYALHGRLDQASQVAERWASRDALDPDALMARADIAARNGDRPLAIKILGSVADVRPDDVTAQTRLATLLDLSGDPSRACAHRIALSEQRASDMVAAGAAIRCSRATGMTTLADRLLADIPNDKRGAVDIELAKAPEDTTALRGDVQLDATWEADVDLDIALIDSNGARLSWLGGGKSKVTARTPVGTRAEAVAFSNLAAGNYIVEVTRVGGSDNIPVNGSVTIRAVGETRKIPFTLSSNRTEVSRVLLSYSARLVPVEGDVVEPWNGPRPTPFRGGPIDF